MKIVTININISFSTKLTITLYVIDCSHNSASIIIKHISNLMNKIHTCLTVEASITIGTFASVCVHTIDTSTAIFAMRYLTVVNLCSTKQTLTNLSKKRRRRKEK